MSIFLTEEDGRQNDVVVVTGASGRLGRRVVPLLRHHFEVVALGRSDVDLTDPAATSRVISAFKPAKILALASYTNVLKAQIEASKCVLDTVLTVQNTLAAARKTGAMLYYGSSDYTAALYRGHIKAHISAGVYAAAKVVAEQFVIAGGGKVGRLCFTTPEQAQSWKWVDAYAKSRRCWVEEAAMMVVEWMVIDQQDQVVDLYGDRLVSNLDLLSERFPDHPALNDIRCQPMPLRPSMSSL